MVLKPTVNSNLAPKKSKKDAEEELEKARKDLERTRTELAKKEEKHKTEVDTMKRQILELMSGGWGAGGEPSGRGELQRFASLQTIRVAAEEIASARESTGASTPRGIASNQAATLPAKTGGTGAVAGPAPHPSLRSAQRAAVLHARSFAIRSKDSFSANSIEDNRAQRNRETPASARGAPAGLPSRAREGLASVPSLRGMPMTIGEDVDLVTAALMSTSSLSRQASRQITAQEAAPQPADPLPPPGQGGPHLAARNPSGADTAAASSRSLAKSSSVLERTAPDVQTRIEQKLSARFDEVARDSGDENASGSAPLPAQTVPGIAPPPLLLRSQDLEDELEPGPAALSVSFAAPVVAIPASPVVSKYAIVPSPVISEPPSRLVSEPPAFLRTPSHGRSMAGGEAEAEEEAPGTPTFRAAAQSVHAEIAAPAPRSPGKSVHLGTQTERGESEAGEGEEEEAQAASREMPDDNENRDAYLPMVAGRARRLPEAPHWGRTDSGKFEHGQGVELLGACSPVLTNQIAVSALTPNIVACANVPANAASVWDFKNGFPGVQVSAALPAHSRPVVACAFSLFHEHVLATASMDETVLVVDYKTGLLLASLEGLAGRITSIAFSPHDPAIIYAASHEHFVKVWDWIRRSEVDTIRVSSRDLRSIAASPHERDLVAVAGADAFLRLYDVRSGRVVQRFEHPNECLQVVFCPYDPDLIAVASGDRCARIFSRQTGEEVLALRGHVSYVVSVSWSAHLQLLATASLDMTCRVWSTTTGESLYTINIYASVRWVAFSPSTPRVLLVAGDVTDIGLARLELEAKYNADRTGFSPEDLANIPDALLPPTDTRLAVRAFQLENNSSSAA